LPILGGRSPWRFSVRFAFKDTELSKIENAMNLSERFRREVVTVNPNDSIRHAARLMSDENVGAVVVVRDQDRKIVGILTDRDIALSIGLGDAEPETFVERVMTKHVATIRDTDDIFNATRCLRAQQVRRLPIVDANEQLVGMIALDDILALLADELQNLSQAGSPALVVHPPS
jgi:CBS domain-containing protein